ATASGPHHYITAAAGSAGGTKSLAVIGSVEPANQAQADFQVAGTVTAGGVSVGQTVAAGQKLATLDTTALSAELTTAQSTLSSAQAKLTEDELEEGSTTTGST